MKLKIGIVQTSVSENIDDNVKKIVQSVNASEDVDIMIFPEGMLSGYYPANSDFLKMLEKSNIQDKLQEISTIVANRKIEVIVPTALKENDKWFNTSIWFGKTGNTKNIYRKCNLSTLDRNHFLAGDKLETLSLNGVTVSIQMCREIMFPEQWLYLKMQGAKIIFHVNNNQDHSSHWEYLLQSRANENQIFIVSVNPTHENQQLFSYVISPKGEILLKTEALEQIYYCSVDLDFVKDTLVSQRRTDLLELSYKK